MSDATLPSLAAGPLRRARALLGPWSVSALILICLILAAPGQARESAEFAARALPMIALAGGLSHFCSCGVIPLIAALLAMGVPLAPVMAYFPAERIAGLPGVEGLGPVAFATLVGVPACLKGYAALPQAGGLIGQGMSPCARLAFLVAGGRDISPCGDLDLGAGEATGLRALSRAVGERGLRVRSALWPPEGGLRP